MSYNRMIIEAHLYFNDVCVAKKMLDMSYPPEFIREMAATPLGTTNFMWSEGDVPELMEMRQNIWIYERRHQLHGSTAIRYDFNGAQSDINFARPMGTSLDIGFDQEPTKEVNLDILAAKLRDNLKTKELLIKYYRR